MIQQIIYTILYLLAFYGIIRVCEFIYKRLKINAELTRKLAHILGSLLCLSFPFLLNNHWSVMIIAITFCLFFYVTHNKGIYPSIHLVKRKSAGSFILPVSIYLLFAIYIWTKNPILYLLPLLILAISDPLAGLAGNLIKTNNKEIIILKYELRKTYVGSLFFFISTFLLTIIFVSIFEYPVASRWFFAFYYALIITLVEMLSKRGYDNLTVPIASVLFLL